jgi:hypothetical protein
MEQFASDVQNHLFQEAVLSENSIRLGIRVGGQNGAESPAQTEQWYCWLCRRRIIF